MMLYYFKELVAPEVQRGLNKAGTIKSDSTFF